MNILCVRVKSFGQWFWILRVLNLLNLLYCIIRLVILYWRIGLHFLHILGKRCHPSSSFWWQWTMLNDTIIFRLLFSTALHFGITSDQYMISNNIWIIRHLPIYSLFLNLRLIMQKLAAVCHPSIYGIILSRLIILT